MISFTLLAHWRRAGSEAYASLRPRSDNPGLQPGPLKDSPGERRLKRDAWWMGWDEAFAADARATLNATGVQ